MELDSLKEIWKESEGKETAVSANEEILAMLNKSSRSPVARMMRNVLAEMILMIVLFGAVSVFYFIAFKGEFSTIAWAYVVLSALCTFYYYRKWKLLHNIQCVACQVKSNLNKQVKTLEKYIRFYLIAGTAMVPVVFIFLGMLFYFKYPEGSLAPVFPPPAAVSAKTWVAWTVSLSLLTGIAWLGNRWYVNRLYGQHIQQLKRLLEQMEE
jgi:hypothetical protein